MEPRQKEKELEERNNKCTMARKRKEKVKEVQVKEAIYSGTERIRSRLCGHKSTCSYDNPKGVEFACVRGGLITEDRRRIYRWEHRSLRRIRHVNPIEPSATTGLRANRSRLIEEGEARNSTLLNPSPIISRLCAEESALSK